MPTKAETLRKWRALGLPASIANWLESLPPNTKTAPYFARADRFVQHCAAGTNIDAKTAQVHKDWAAVSGVARPGHDAPELSVFMGLPDALEFNPYARVYGGRRLDAATIKIERARYAELRKHAQAIAKALSNDAVRKLLQDASATPVALALAAEFRAKHLSATHAGLRALDKLLGEIEPSAKVPTEHPFKAGAEQSIFVNLVADLNRYLPKPQHAALARLARVNCPDATAKVPTVGAAWNRANKRP